MKSTQAAPKPTSVPLPVAEPNYLKQKRATLVIVHFSSGTFLDSNDYDMFVTYKDVNGSYVKINIKEGGESFFKLYHGDTTARYQAIDRFNPSHYLHFTGRAVERLEFKREKV